MSTEAIGAYSPDTVYGQLTSPFTPQKIKINAHTPYDKVDENKSKVFSREHFKGKPQAKMIYELPEDKNSVNIANKEFPPKYNGNKVENNKDTEEKTTIDVTTFQASKASSKDIVQNSLKHGYTPEQAVAINKAQEAYKKSAILTKDPAATLSTRSYKVA